MTDPIVLNIAKRLRLIVHELEKHSKFLQESYGTTLPQLLCLHEIQNHGPITIGELGRILFVNGSTITGIVDRLEKQNLVRRTRISKDRRKIHVEITSEGVKFLTEAPEVLQDEFIAAWHKLKNEEMETILKAMKKLTDLWDYPGKTKGKHPGINTADIADSVINEGHEVNVA